MIKFFRPGRPEQPVPEIRQPLGISPYHLGVLSAAQFDARAPFPPASRAYASWLAGRFEEQMSAYRRT